MDRIAGPVEELLSRGEENARSTAELIQLLSVDVRRLRLLVARERATGALILSSNSGYYLPDEGQKGREELRRFVAFAASKGVGTLAAVKAARRALRELEGQMTIEEETT